MKKNHIILLFISLLCLWHCKKKEAPIPAAAKQAPSAKDPAPLLKIFEDLDGSLIGELGVSVLHIESGQRIAHRGDERFPMQSVYKFPIAMVMLHDIDRGLFSLQDTIAILPKEYIPRSGHSPLRDQFPNGVQIPLQEVLAYNISQSDGTACDVLLRLLGGTAAVDNRVHRFGSDSIAIATTEMVQVANDTIQYRNWSTPNGMNELLVVFQSEEYLSDESSELLKEMMSVSTPWFDRRIKGRLPQGTPVAHKTGTAGTYNGLNRATNDVGIISLPNGEHLAVSVFVKDSRDQHSAREEAIARVARAAYDFWLDGRSR
jgi:beta-lactamase class A